MIKTHEVSPVGLMTLLQATEIVFNWLKKNQEKRRCTGSRDLVGGLSGMAGSSSLSDEISYSLSLSSLLCCPWSKCWQKSCQAGILPAWEN